MADDFTPDDPRFYTHELRNDFATLKEKLRTGIEKVDEPQAKAMMESAAEVLKGLQEAFKDYEEGDEKAWERDTES